MSNIGKIMNEVAKYAKPFEQAADAMETLGAMKALVLLAKGDLKGAIAAFKEGASAAKAIMDLGKEALFPGLQMKPQSMSGNNQVGKPDQPSIGSASDSFSKKDKPGIEGALDDLINMATVVKKMLGAFKKHAMNQMPKSPLEALSTMTSKHSAPSPSAPGPHTGTATPTVATKPNDAPPGPNTGTATPSDAPKIPQPVGA